MEEQIPTNEPEEQMTPTVGGNVVPAPVLCGEEWCVAVGNCDGRHLPMLNGVVRCEACYETTDCECEECSHCGELDNEMMWCTDCEIEMQCRDCWNGCACDGDE